MAGLQLPAHHVPGDWTTCPRGFPVPWECHIAGAGKHLRGMVTAWGFPALLHLRGCWSLGLVMEKWRWSTWGNLSSPWYPPPCSARQPGCPWESSLVGWGCLPAHSRAATRNATLSLQGLSGNPGTHPGSPSSPLQGVVVGACAAPAQAETIPLFGGAGGAKLPGKGATGASPGGCLSPAGPRG